MRVDGKFLAVDGFPFFDGNFLAVDGNSNFDGKSPLYRDRPPVRYFHVGNITEHLPENKCVSCLRANLSMPSAYCHASILATTLLSPSAVPCVVFVIVIGLYVHHFNCSLSVPSVYIVSIIPPEVSSYWRDV